MDFRITTRPTQLPLTLKGVKDYCQEVETLNDSLLNQLLDAVIDDVQNKTNMILAPVTIEQYIDKWPADNCIKLRWNPLISITHIKYYDEDDVLTTIDSADYYSFIRSKIHYISFKKGVTKPTVRGHENDIIITYIAGHDPAYNVSANIKDSILMKIRTRYDKRMDDEERTDHIRVSDLLLNPFIIYV